MTAGGMLVAGTTSDAGKSLVTAGICRWLHRQGVKVAPFKAQNMSNNSVVALDAPAAADGPLTAGEIGRAQALQAAACGLQPSVRFNPVLLKPSSDYTSQVVVMGHATGSVSANNFRAMQRRLSRIAYDALEQLRSEFEVVICEGAGSLAEINLRDTDYVNMGLARRANWPVIVVGDIDRGGLFASLYGSIALLSPADQQLVGGFVVNKFRGDAGLLKPGLHQLEQLTGRPVLGVLPWQLGLWLDSEDTLAPGPFLGIPSPPLGRQWLRVAVVRLPHISNATDADPLAAEPGVQVRFTIDPADLAAADLLVIPGSKSTVRDLQWLRQTGLAGAIAAHAAAGRPLLGICGGYQMLARRLHDDVESAVGTIPGLGILPLEFRFSRDKTLARSGGTALGAPVSGYEIHLGQELRRAESLPSLITRPGGSTEGAHSGNVFGTHWHGLFENNEFRRAFLTLCAGLAGRPEFVVSPNVDFPALRERFLDQLGDLVEHHLDTAAIRALIRRGAPDYLPLVSPLLVPGRADV